MIYMSEIKPAELVISIIISNNVNISEVMKCVRRYNNFGDD